MDHQAARVADVRQVREELNALDPEREHRARTRQGFETRILPTLKTLLPSMQDDLVLPDLAFDAARELDR